MDRFQKGSPSGKDNVLPVERNSQKQSTSGQAVDHTTSNQSTPLTSSHLSLLANFGLSFEDLEELSHYPADQLTPEKMPVLLQAIQKRKQAAKAPTVPSKRTEVETVPSAGGCGPTVQRKVIDYGHKSKYEYSPAPTEAKASPIGTEESKKVLKTQPPAPAAASSLISNPKNPTEELGGQKESQANTPNSQVFPPVGLAKKVPSTEPEAPVTAPLTVPAVVPPTPQPVMPPVIPPNPPNPMSAVDQRPSPFAPEFLSGHGRYENPAKAGPPSHPCQTTDGQKGFQEAEDRVRSPFGVVKASWLPDFSQADKQKERKLPSAPQMCDYYAVTPRTFPHICSLCDKDCLDKEDWIEHQNSRQHNENCRMLVFQHPDWTPETLTSPTRPEDDRQERHDCRQHSSASPSAKCSRGCSCAHARHWTRSRSRSSERHRTSRTRSRSPRRFPSSRYKDESRWHSGSRSPECSRYSSSAHGRRRTRSRSRSPGYHRASRPRSRSPRRHYSPRHDIWKRHESRRRSASPSPKRFRYSFYGRHRTRSRSRSPARYRTSRSPRRLSSPRHWSRSRSRSPETFLRANRWSQSSSSKERRSGSSTRSSGGRQQHAKKPHSQKRHGEPGSQKQSRKQPDVTALASLTEKSVLQAMAQLQAQGAADGTLAQEGNSSDCAAGGTNTPAGSSNILSMIQQVAKQVITAVLDSRETSTPQASRSKRKPNPPHTHSGVKKSKTKSASSLQDGTTENTHAKKCKGDTRSDGTSLRSKPEKKGKAGPCPEKSRPSCSVAKEEHVGSPPTQQGSAASGEEEKQPVVDQLPEEGIASSNKAANKDTAPSSTAENQGVVGACSKQASLESQGVNPQQGAAKSTEAEPQSQGSPSPKKGASSDSKAQEEPVGSPSTQQGSAASGEEEKQPVVDQLPEEGIASSNKAANEDTAPSSTAENQGVVGACSKQGSPGGSELESQGVNPQQGAAKSTEAEPQSQGSPSPKKGASLDSKAQEEPVVSPSVQQGPAAGGEEEKQPVVDQLPEQDTAASSKAAKNSVVGISLQQGTAASDQAGSPGVVGTCPQQTTDTVSSQEAGPCPQESTPPCSQPENNGAVSPSAQQDIAVRGKSENQGVASCSLKEATAGNNEVESLPVVDPGPSPGSAVIDETENKSLGVPLVPGSVGPGSGTPGEASKPRVCIFGDSLVVSAQERAVSSTFGLQLGLEDLVCLDWHGQEVMTWTTLVPAIEELVAQGHTPDVLVFHLRGDDFVYTMEFGLFTTVKKTLFLLRECLPQVKIIWSEIIPQGSWHGVKRKEQREKLNTAVGESCRSFGGSVIPHPGFSSEDCELYTDKADLSLAGLDLFLEELQSGILDHLGQPRRAVRRLPKKAAQKVATREDEVSSSKEESSKQTVAGEAAVSPQPGASGYCEAKNQDVEQKVVAGSIPPCPVPAGVKRKVLVVGHSIVIQASEYASSSGWDSNLGLGERLQIKWSGWREMKWASLLPTVEKEVFLGGSPDALIIQLGEEDLPGEKGIVLSRSITSDLQTLHQAFPDTLLFWSCLLERKEWKGGVAPCKVDLARRRVSKAVCKFMGTLGGRSIRHPDISFRQDALYREDGVQLTEWGLDLWLHGIRHALLTWLQA